MMERVIWMGGASPGGEQITRIAASMSHCGRCMGHRDQASSFQLFPFKHCFLCLIRKRTPELILWYKFTCLTISNHIKNGLIAQPVSWPLWRLWFLSLIPSALSQMYLWQNYSFLCFIIKCSIWQCGLGFLFCFVLTGKKPPKYSSQIPKKH